MRYSSERGQTLVESSLVLGVLMMVLLGVFDLGRAFYAQNVIANAAREGARYAIVQPDDTVGITDATKAKVIGLNTDELSVGASWPEPDAIRVEVTYDFHVATALIAGFLGGGDSLQLRSAATMYVEQ